MMLKSRWQTDKEQEEEEEGFSPTIYQNKIWLILELLMEKGIKQIGDRVRVESQLGQGSRFGVNLSSPVQNETCLANELKSPRLKLS